eukprot:scaffold157753_cov20-Tisochrysis_lutea.AAC.1
MYFICVLLQKSILRSSFGSLKAPDSFKEVHKVDQSLTCAVSIGSMEVCDCKRASGTLEPNPAANA